MYRTLSIIHYQSSILPLLLFLLAILPLHAQTTIDSPVYLGSILIEEPTVETMSATCERYGLTASTDTIDGYIAYTHPDGTLIRFKMTSASNGHTVPLIEITTQKSAKQIDKILLQTGYERIKEGYAKGSQHANRRTVCYLNKSKSINLIFTKAYRY